MNVQIPMSKGACIAFECLRAAWRRHFDILALSFFRISSFGFRHLNYGFVILSSFLIRISSLTFPYNQQYVEEHQII